ncbi:jg26499 [Pararge aegeria aegeria]|uniref:Jg26499 protein n=1 Tax=Pararge aegeria aegeria TaxID=348720 RepID=A0A8S4S4H6_9NEOP|nr:jg26499 [Pararge aegeria aegeria]
MDVGVPRCSNGDFVMVNAVADTRRGEQMTSNESLGAIGLKRYKTAVFQTPYKRPINLQLVDKMLMTDIPVNYIVLSNILEISQ